MDICKAKLLNNWFDQNKSGYKSNTFSWVHNNNIMPACILIKLPTYLTERIGIYYF